MKSESSLALSPGVKPKLAQPQECALYAYNYVYEIAQCWCCICNLASWPGWTRADVINESAKKLSSLEPRQSKKLALV